MKTLDVRALMTTQKPTTRQRALIRVAMIVKNETFAGIDMRERIDYAMAWVRMRNGGNGVQRYLYDVIDHPATMKHYNFIRDVKTLVAEMEKDAEVARS